MNALDVIVQLWWFLLGGVVGSFLNVVIYRLPRGESIIWPGSHCPHCAHPIRWFDNLPILSWFMLRGRCRDCGTPIPVRYPVVESLGSLIVGAVSWWASEGHWSPWFTSGMIATAEFAALVFSILSVSAFYLTLVAIAAISWDQQPSRFVVWWPAAVLVLTSSFLWPSHSMMSPFAYPSKDLTHLHFWMNLLGGTVLGLAADLVSRKGLLSRVSAEKPPEQPAKLRKEGQPPQRPLVSQRGHSWNKLEDAAATKASGVNYFSWDWTMATALSAMLWPLPWGIILGGWALLLSAVAYFGTLKYRSQASKRAIGQWRRSRAYLLIIWAATNGALLLLL